MRRLYLVAYDIHSSAIRRKAREAVKGFAVGGQKSVFECWLDEGEFQCMRTALEALVNQGTDRVFIVELDPRAAIHTLGRGIAPVDDVLFYIG